MRFILFSFLFFLFSTSSFAQSKVVQTLKDSNFVQLGLYFTPSTLRMLNIQRDSAYDEMIRGVEKMNVLIMKPNRFTKEHYYDTFDALTAEEAYEEYIILENNDYELKVLGKPKKQELVGMANYGNRYYIFNLKGTIDLTKIPDIYQRVTTQDSTALSGFSMVLDMVNRDEKRRVWREQWEKEQEERRRKKKEEAKLRADSLRADSLLKIEQTHNEKN